MMKVLINILIFQPTSDSYGQEMSYGKQNKATFRAIVIIFQALLANRILKLLKTFPLANIEPISEVLYYLSRMLYNTAHACLHEVKSHSQQFVSEIHI